MKTIKLSRGKEAVVDDEDFEALSRHKWSALKATSGSWYAVRMCGGAYLYMHAIVAGTPKGKAKTDHIDGDGLNNRRGNLRICTNKQNAHNHTRKRKGCGSQYRGVSLHRATGKWLVQIRTDGIGRYVGLFESEIDAAGAYDAAGFARDPEHFTPNFSASWLSPVATRVD